MLRRMYLRSKVIILLCVVFAVSVLQLSVAAGEAASLDIYGNSKPGWWSVGVEGGIPDVKEVGKVTDFGAVPNDKTDDLNAFKDAIDHAFNAGGGAILVPAGTYVLKGPIVLKSGVVLRGEGAGNTHLEFDSRTNIIKISGSTIGKSIEVVGDHAKGSTAITLADASSIKAGDIIEISVENDKEKMVTNPEWDQEWARRSVGQNTKVVAVNGNKVEIADQLRNEYKAAFAPNVYKVDPVVNSGIEYLHIYRVDNNDVHGVTFERAYNCWMRGVEVNNVRKSTVQVMYSYRVEIRDSYFHDATDFSGGGHGYGIELMNRSSNCLVENNIFKKFRHSMLLQYGANGNVFGYNYSRELGNDILPDISLHGTWTHENLFEANVVERAGVGDYWGPAPYNTFLRNIIEMNLFVEDSSNHTYAIGNEIRGNKLKDVGGSRNKYFKGYHGVNIDFQGVVPGGVKRETLIIHGNYETEKVYWEEGINDHTIPASYYHKSKPAFLGNRQWPVLGPDVMGKGTIPAQERWDSGKMNVKPVVKAALPAVEPTPVPAETQVLPETQAPEVTQVPTETQSPVETTAAVESTVPAETSAPTEDTASTDTSNAREASNPQDTAAESGSGAIIIIIAILVVAAGGAVAFIKNRK